VTLGSGFQGITIYRRWHGERAAQKTPIDKAKKVKFLLDFTAIFL